MACPANQGEYGAGIFRCHDSAAAVQDLRRCFRGVGLVRGSQSFHVPTQGCCGSNLLLIAPVAVDLSGADIPMASLVTDASKLDTGGVVGDDTWWALQNLEASKFAAGTSTKARSASTVGGR